MSRSLYFDTLDDQDFADKVDGLELRRKIRLRIYSPSASFAMLEMKQKEGAYQRKRSLRLNREDAERLCRGDYHPLQAYDDPFAASAMACCTAGATGPRPWWNTSLALFVSDLSLSPVLDPWRMVLEVKYNGFLLSYLKDLLNQVDRPELSVSQYCLARGIRS